MNKLWKTTQNQHRVKVLEFTYMLTTAIFLIHPLIVEQYRENISNRVYCITPKTCG